MPAGTGIRIVELHMSEAVFQPGQVIFREGDASQEAYRILRGRVEISILADGKPVILAQLGEGDIFGEMAMVDERPRSASAQALEVTECEVLTPENFNDLVLQRPEVLIPYMASFFERLRTANDRLRLEMRLRAKAESQLSTGATPAPVARVAVPVITPIAPPSLELTRVAPPAPMVVPAGQPVASAPAPVAPPPAGGYQSVVLTALTEHAKARLPEAVVTIGKFPFRIGRKHDTPGKGATVFASNDLPIGDEKPYQISRNHCSIEREGDHFFVRDRGSSVGTVVNDKPIGLAEDTLTCDLQGGDNILLLGADDSPFKFKVTLS
ncbi:MAG: FHA domain-containing protein [Verrucomicrobia bacterium]|nr:FHA domain-containing protein [Verrucomicrobiota bacterium]